LPVEILFILAEIRHWNMANAMSITKYGRFQILAWCSELVCAALPLVILAATAAFLVAGECAAEPDLSFIKNHISEFAARQNFSGSLVRLSMWGFGFTYIVTAAIVIHKRNRYLLAILGALCLSAASSLLPFVAEYHLWVPQAQRSFWNWLPFHSDIQIPDDWKVRQEIHGNAIEASMCWVFAGMLLIGAGARKTGLWKWSCALAPSALVLFFLSNQPIVAWIKGLVEWGAFLCIALWIVMVIRIIGFSAAETTSAAAVGQSACAD